MTSLGEKSEDISISVNILIKEEDGMYVAHCLELDVVAVSKTPDQAQREVISLICAQVDYAFSNNNLNNLYHPAPPEVWTEFFKCKEQIARKYKLQSGFKKSIESILPPWLIANTCQPGKLCHV
ncbi:MAG: hypothetical protein KKC76_04985 [Proteobacteria bacterium]|nr:hypothetical protein [Pseudomonadota bacterium]MBU4295061.1 hypothetical protein [Pseudomonadota bacterium]MCG2748052.1 hypothetical protein [Desulfobulbaceae bacterium]